MSSYKKLAEIIKDANNIHYAMDMLHWDQDVMMPPESAVHRGEILGTLSVLHHEKTTADHLRDLIEGAEIEDLDDWDKRNLKLIRREYILKKAVPENLVREIMEAGAAVQAVWKKAKPDNDWKSVRPYLEKSIAVTIEQAKIFGDVLQRDPYDALLSRFSTGNSRAVIDPLFAHLKQELPPLIRQIADRQKNSPVQNPVVAETARDSMTHELAGLFGFDFSRGRIDKAAHPFSGGTPRDTRFTISTTLPALSNVHSLMHEVGHAVYTQNLPSSYAGQPVGGESDITLHESQSLFIEKQIGFSAAFMPFLHKTIMKHDPGFSGTAEDLRIFFQRVEPGFIRIRADEATYPLHVILRYEIEKDLFSGAMRVADLPEVWNAKIKEYLGLDVPDDTQGCLQDTHWYSAYGFGYFPTYTQGALYAAQLAAAVKRDIPDFDDRVGRGDFRDIMQWMKNRIHIWGQYYDAPDLIEKATGERPDARFFIEHLKNRYLAAE